MEELGVIRGATTHINYRLFGFKAVAHIIITIDPAQADQLTAYLQKMADVYAFYSRGIRGNIDILTILKTFEQLSEIKDRLNSNFTVLEMKTAIWTDVKEMNYNLSIIDENRVNPTKATAGKSTQIKQKKTTDSLDDVDQKMADVLAENGRISMAELGKRLGISPNNAKRRYEKLKEEGVLKITIQVNPRKIGYQALCIFFTTISNEKLPSIIGKISVIPDIISIMKTTGDYDLQIYAMVQDLNQMLSIKERIADIEGIQRMDFEINRINEELDKWPSPRQYISTF